MPKFSLSEEETKKKEMNISEKHKTFGKFGPVKVFVVK